ncbi:MAG: PaaI family thioesterase [Candidatus Dadabacteria bacterium]|nr:MAG: PaaI family thioesterase [Candidatus Dadabacteria bacterium]
MGLSLEELRAFLAREFPQSTVTVEAAGQGSARVRQPVDERHLRPGGTVSGPTLAAVADVALYAAILAEIGAVALAVTTNLTLNFMRRPPAGRDLVGHCKLLKLGRRLAVGEVYIYSDGIEDPVAHAVGTYSIPPPERGGPA